MMRRATALSTIALALLTLPALTGCFLQKKVAPPVIAVAPPPEPAPMPLYTSELAQSDEHLPQLPPVPSPSAQPAPPPLSEVSLVRKRPSSRLRSRKADTELAARETASREAAVREKDAAGGVDMAAANPQTNPASAADASAKVTAKAPTGDNGVATPIGQLTAGAGQDTPQSSREAATLIQNTEHGVDSLHRGLSGDESKTVTQIHSFLQQAMRALHNGDVDGAFTLATKAKVLLAELTGSE